MRRFALFTPSLSSGTFAVVGAIIILALQAWSFITAHQLFYDYLFGVYGFKTQLLLSSDSFEVFRQRLFTYNPITYYVFIGVAAAIIGLVVFTILDIITRTIRGVSEMAEEVETAGETFTHSELILRTGIRVLAILGWAGYFALFISILLPYCVLTLNSGLEDYTLGNAAGGWSILLALVVLTVGIHMHATFARLVRLRVRLYGDIIDY